MEVGNTKQRLYALAPEVAGGWGERTVVLNQTALNAGAEIVPKVGYLHYRFDGWLGDDLLGFISTYIVTTRLADAMRSASLTGFRFAPMTTTASDMWEQWHPRRKIPTVEHLLPEGKIVLQGWQAVSWSGEDVCFGPQEKWVKPVTYDEIVYGIPPYSLVVSERAFKVLRNFKLANCEVHELRF